MDAGFYRGTSADQDNRFGDKEKKLLKQMKFEAALDQKVDMSKVNLEVVKPWITGKLNDILGVEDDVVIEYVFTQLEEKDINPKVMQINLTGFLNARRAREFVGELWAMLVEAQSSADGIPSAILEKKMQELKASGSSRFAEPPLAKVISNDWKHRYQSLTGGRYGKAEPNYESQPMAFDPTDKSERIPSPRGRRHDDRDRDRDRRGDRWDRDRERDRDRHHRDRERRSRERDVRPARRRTPSRSPPPPRKPKEEERRLSKRHHSSDEGSGAESDREVKKRKKKAHRHSDDSDSERERRKAEKKKHKKEKKEKKEKKKKREKEESD